MSQETGYSPPSRALGKIIDFVPETPAANPAPVNTFAGVNPLFFGFTAPVTTAFVKGTLGSYAGDGSRPAPFVQSTTFAPPTVRAAPPRGALGQGGGY